MTDEAKSILDRWATIILKRDAIYFDSSGEARPNQDKNQHYQDVGYSDDIVLWIPPKDCLRLEFESTPEKNRKWIAEIESSAKSLEYDYCVTEHRNCKSPYFNIFNIKGMPLNEDNRLAKMMLIEQLCPSQEARDSLDKTNLGWTFSPVIGNPHWKPKYNGAIHEIVRGTHPIGHENNYPKKFLKAIEKSKEMFKQASATANSDNNWVMEFLTKYCLTNRLPEGERHNVIEKNLAIAIIHNPDRDKIERQYAETQHQPFVSLQGWYSAIIKGSITEINSGEIANYIKRNNIPFSVPDLKSEGVVCVQNSIPDKDGWIKIGEYIPTGPERAEKPEITLPVTGKLISTFASEIIPFFKDKHEVFYRYREFKVQKLEMMPVKVSNNHKVKVLGFKDVMPNELITYLEKYVIPIVRIYNIRKNRVEIKPKSVGSDLAKTLLESQQFRDNLPLIDVLFEAPMPILVDAELLFPKEGYDERFQSWLPYGSPVINPDMTLEDAKATIDFIYAEFCFETPQDRTNAIAGLITSFIRGLYVRPTCRTPIFFYKANREGAGKDYCGKIPGLVMSGVAHGESPLSDGKETHDEEFRKKILSTFRMGRNRLHLENNKGFINSAVLESISTTESFSDRILGSNTTLTFPNTLELSLSANTGITYTADLVRRCVFINLFLDIENPMEREFKSPDLHGWVLTHRSEILSSLYALVRNWHEKGMPNGKVSFASFPEWARVCGGIMETAGYDSPCVVRDDSGYVGGDTKTKDMKTLYEVFFATCGERQLSKKEMLDMIHSQTPPELGEIFTWIDWTKEQSARTKISLLIDEFVGRELSGLKLMRMGEGEKRNRRFFWKKMERPKKDECTLCTQSTLLEPTLPKKINDSSPMTEMEKGTRVQANMEKIEEFVEGDTDSPSKIPTLTISTGNTYSDWDIEREILATLEHWRYDGITLFQLKHNLSSIAPGEQVEKVLSRIARRGDAYEPRKDLWKLRV